MLGIQEFWLFIISGLLLNITPGPDTAYIVGRSVQIGMARRCGGGARHLHRLPGSRVRRGDRPVGAAGGVIGRVHRGEMGRRRLSLLHGHQDAAVAARARRAADAAAASDAIPLRQVFWQGALTNVLNPKVALFFLAFLPQFVAADAPHKAAAFVLLGLIFIFNGTLWCLGVAAFAARAAGRVRQSGQALLWINRALGGLFVYLGVRIAMLQAR